VPPAARLSKGLYFWSLAGIAVLAGFALLYLVITFIG